ncbi:MAG: hypothetical protein JRI77_08555, partial [Deltaproteobacteria bacterium]|nr:hypothetical protein [Deltaproteobacteria bacterium]
MENMMKTDRITMNTFRILLLFLLIAALLGCQSVLHPYKGKPVSLHNQIPLIEGGPHQGDWKTEDLSFKYNYVKRSGKLDISGNLALHAASFWTYEIVDLLFFRINFIDSSGRLIESRVLWSTVFG